MSVRYYWARSKSYLAEQYPDLGYEWLSYGAPRTLVLDNGREFHAYNFKRLLAELDIEAFYCPTRKPHYKGVIERFFKTMNNGLIHNLPGTTFSNVQDRGDYDSESKACLTLEELIELFHEWLLGVYVKSVNSTTERTPEHLWKEGLGNVAPVLPGTREQLDIVFTQSHQCKLSHEGLRVEDLHYNSLELGELRHRAEHTNDKKYTIRVDPEDLSRAWVHDQYDDSYFKVPCTDHEYAKGLTSFQHKKVREHRREEKKKFATEQSLAEGKAKLAESVKQKSTDKLIRERKKATRLDSAELANSRREPPCNDTKSVKLDVGMLPKFSTEERKRDD
jgi:putative transposase